jgi:hypothetical protein
MSAFTQVELERMRATQAEYMQDRCDLMVWVESDQTDAYGQPLSDYVPGATVMCGLDLRSSAEYPNGEPGEFDARLRLRLDVAVSHIDRVRVTHRYGNVLPAPLLFDLIGPARPGVSAQVLDLRSVL